MIDTIIARRSNGNAAIASTTKTKIMLKGISPDRYTVTSPDDEAVIARLRSIASEMGVSLS